MDISIVVIQVIRIIIRKNFTRFINFRSAIFQLMSTIIILVVVVVVVIVIIAIAIVIVIAVKNSVTNIFLIKIVFLSHILNDAFVDVLQKTLQIFYPFLDEGYYHQNDVAQKVQEHTKNHGKSAADLDINVSHEVSKEDQ